MQYLDDKWFEADKVSFTSQEENDAVTELHDGTGMGIRHYWGFWKTKKNRLVRELERYGFVHPDDKSSTILSLFYRKLTDPDFDLQTELDEYKSINKNLKKQDIAFRKYLRKTSVSISVGYTVQIPLSVYGGHYATISDFSPDDFDYIITGTVVKKRGGRMLRMIIETDEVSCGRQNRPYEKSKYTKGYRFDFPMAIFKIIIDGQPPHVHPMTRKYKNDTD